MSVVLIARDAHAYLAPDQAFPGLFDSAGTEQLPVPNLDTSSQNQLPIPNIDDAAAPPVIPDLDLFGNPPIPTLDLFPDGTGSSSGGGSGSGGGSSGGGGSGGGGGGRGTDPNYVLYGSPPGYAPVYGPYDPYTGQLLPGATLSVRDPNSGAPLSGTGPGTMLATGVIAGSAVLTIRKAMRKKTPLD